jgi:hypothetical protein
MPYKDPIKQKEAQHKSYLKNIEKVKEKNKTYKQKIKEHVRKEKESKPCFDCNKFYPYYVMEYDHIENNKILSVSRLSKTGTINQVLDEIKKCELVCSNCHKFRTWNRMQK